MTPKQYITGANSQFKSFSDQADGVWMKTATQTEKNIVRVYRNSLRTINRELADMYRIYGDDVTIETMRKYNRLSKLSSNMLDHAREMGLNVKREIGQFGRGSYEQGYYYNGYFSESTLDASLGMGQLNPKVITQSVKNPLEHVQWTGRLSKNVSFMHQKVMDAVTEGLVQGYGYSKTSQLIRDTVERDAYKATRIMWTESSRVRSEARNEAYELSQGAADRLGVEIKKIWDATLDSRTRPEHGALDGVPAEDVDGVLTWTFSNGITTTGPSLSGNASMDIQCRCTTRVEVDDMKPDTRLDVENKKTIPYTTYPEWSKANKIRNIHSPKPNFKKAA